jgi:hypothetical protein
VQSLSVWPLWVPVPLRPPAYLVQVLTAVDLFLPGYGHGNVNFFTVDRRLMLQNVLALGIVRLFGCFHANNSPDVEQTERGGEQIKAVPVSSKLSVGTHQMVPLLASEHDWAEPVKCEFNKEDRFVQNPVPCNYSLVNRNWTYVKQSRHSSAHVYV